ncbi:uncharacterized protein LOC112560142 isoform X2 [Pomacea canaliculata]|uniref:uncharacterized protein LOC112560142 isoform X2 n=1 Tax=Pomacea canaliculata TaxID=400727 RepID=UPI000D7318F8|nr:uncharacterized protein LOC112560142 isoform X2 [Pomacea canaliculata]
MSISLKGYSLRPLPPLPATVSGLKMKMFVRQLLSLWSLLLTVPISARSCTKDVTCTFGSGQCGWYSLSEKQFESKRSDAQANVTSLYGSPPICSTKHAHSFTFRYSLENGKNCYMTSYVSRSDGKNISLWDSSVFVEHGPYSQLLPALVCPQDTTFQIIIQVTKIRRGECGEVRIDDVKYDLTRDTRTCTVTPSTSTPSVQGKTSLEVTSADTLSSLNSNSVTTNIVTVSSLLSESSHTGTTLSSNSAKSSTDLRETEKKSPATSAPAVQVNISSGTPPAGTLSSPNSTLETSHPYYPERFSATTLLPQETPSSSHSAMSVTDVKSPEAQRGSASQDKMSAGLGAGIGITVCIIFIVSASVTVIVVRKKSKATSEKRTNIILNTAASIHETAGNEKPRNTQEPIAPDGDMTVHTELPVHQRTTRDDRMTSSDHVITEGDSFQDSSQENYSVLFSKVSGEQTTQHFELDTYSHLQAQSAAGDVSHDNKTLRISELEQRNMSADSKASAPPATDDDYVALRASLNSHGIASDVYDHLKNELYVNDPTKR